jgi:transcriptional regulator
VYTPAHFHDPDGTWAADLVRSNPLALLASNGADCSPHATHLPIVTQTLDADLAGTRLLGHMNRANPHWAALESGTPVVASFTGPHAYVSPAVYEVSPAAPTWNFTAVHVRGTLTKLDPGESTLAVVRATVAAFDARFGTGWDMSDSVDYFRRIVPAVGAFHLDVTSVEGMFKLSQEQEPAACGSCQVR